MRRTSACLLLAAGILLLAAAPARADGLGFSAGQAGQGRVCYFGECSDEDGSYTGTQTSAQPAPAPVENTNYADEATDYGVAPQRFLQDNVGAPTPLEIPGGTMVTTAAVVEAMNRRVQFLLIDALDSPGHRSIPNAYDFGYAGRGGDFEDNVQQQLWRELSSLTGRRADYPLVFFCQGSRCWESYNAALRAIHMGFSNVYWYRGGLSAWQSAGLPMAGLGSN
jgi:PQQ-dependent catabolism-associated CXXCW motif protein